MNESESGIGLGFLIATVFWAIFVSIILASTDFAGKIQAMNNATIAPSLEEINKSNEECMNNAKDISYADKCFEVYKANIYIYNQITKR